MMSDNFDHLNPFFTFGIKDIFANDYPPRGSHKKKTLILRCYFENICSGLLLKYFCCPGDSLRISDYSGDFEESRLIEAREIFLIAGGTGLYASNNQPRKMKQTKTCIQYLIFQKGYMLDHVFNQQSVHQLNHRSIGQPTI